VRYVLPLIAQLAVRLRSSTPVDARGMARLRRLLCDSAGPCYARIDIDALTVALTAISEQLDIQE
jgi:hypothetical protein